jgi:hypothetical protein
MTLGIGMTAVGAGYTIVLAGENSSSIVDFGAPRSSNTLALIIHADPSLAWESYRAA